MNWNYSVAKQIDVYQDLKNPVIQDEGLISKDSLNSVAKEIEVTSPGSKNQSYLVIYS